MPKKKQPESRKQDDPNVMGLRAEVLEQPICQTLESNYMPYAMSVIVSRAIPEIDGFKPSHRKLLYTMYEMGLLTKPRTKSANIVGQTMKLNPHGDAAIYETMVRLARGNETLLHPFVDSKGNFGKVYSRDMAYAASRYTEAKLEPICQELFRDIDADTVDFVDNYDGSMQEPVLLPTTFPNVLVSANMGIAVGMASNICSFNLAEVCRTTIALIKNPDADLLDTLPAPDFPTGGEILYDPAQMLQIYQTGRGSFRLRAKWRYVKEGNMIEIYEIPYTTATEIILDKVAELIKANKVREISDMRDETDLNGLKLTIDLKRGADPDKLMQKLFKTTTLQDAFGCNFNILIAGMPRVMGVREILQEWTAWRTECVRRRLYFQMNKKKDKLHLLKGLGRILLDIDKAIAIIRETELDAEVVPNLMIGFGIDQIQAEYVAEIKLRNINKEFILNRLKETESLEQEIAELEATLGSEKKVQALICKELEQVAQKYGKERKTTLVYDHELQQEPDDEPENDYPGHRLPLPRGLFQEDHGAVAAHVRRAEIQGGRQPASDLPRAEQQRNARLHRQISGLQDAASPNLPTARLPRSAITCPASSASTRARASSRPYSPENMRGTCSSSSKTARRPRSPPAATTRSPTASGSPAPTPTRARSGRSSTCRRRSRSSSVPRMAARSSSPRPSSPSRPPVRRRAWP